MIKTIINDFNSVYEGMNYLLNRKVPKGIAILYYIVMLPSVLLIYPFAKIWSMMILRKLKKNIEDWA